MENNDVNADQTSQRLRLTLLGDSCSGRPDAPHERNLAKLSAVILQQNRPADALLYLGDHIAGYADSEARVSAEWDHFLGREFRDLHDRYPRNVHIPGNHDAYDPMSAAICARRMPFPADARRREGLNFVTNVGDAEIVCISTCDLANRGMAAIDFDWLEESLKQPASAPLRLVAGHFPIHPVNGYDEAPTWVFPKAMAERIWRLFAETNVLAYLCSHIIAFDFQIHDDIVQLCSGGGGTIFGPGGAMGDGEYRHYVSCEVTPERFWFETTDEDGMKRESAMHVYGADRAP